MKIYWKSGRELTDLEEGAIAENDGVVFWRVSEGGSYCSAGGLVRRQGTIEMTAIRSLVEMEHPTIGLLQLRFGCFG